MDKSKFAEMITKVFGRHELEDYKEFSPIDFTMYNFALITAQFNKNRIEFETGKS